MPLPPKKHIKIICLFIKKLGQAWWLTALTPVSLDAEAGVSEVQGQPVNVEILCVKIRKK